MFLELTTVIFVLMGTRRKWTLKEKIEILEAAASGDVIGVCRQYGVSTATYYSWRKRFESKGEDGLKETYKRQDIELKEAEEKIRVLSKLLAERDIELEVQREMLKKKFGTSDPRKI